MRIFYLELKRVLKSKFTLILLALALLFSVLLAQPLYLRPRTAAKGIRPAERISTHQKDRQEQSQGGRNQSG